MESQQRRPVMLAVLDGWGWRDDPADNAVRQARTPNFDRLWATCPHALLRTSGRDVGLPEGQMGNSEVGHLNIGAGRLVLQDLPRINEAIAAGEIARAPALAGLIERLRATGGTCHLLGLVSPGGVHSHQDHAAALARILAGAGVPTVVHAFTDGRDTPPRSAGDDIARLLAALPPRWRSRRSAAATMPWTATGAGNAWPRPILRWRTGRGRVSRCARRSLPTPTRTISATSSCCRRWSANSAACATATACCASISAPTACARFSPPCSTRRSPASRARARSGSRARPA